MVLYIKEVLWGVRIPPLLLPLLSELRGCCCSTTVGAVCPWGTTPNSWCSLGCCCVLPNQFGSAFDARVR